MRSINLFLKRTMDLLGGAIGLLLISPILLLLSVLIKIDTKGPVFFKQERLGKNGKVFKIIKFRTMVVNAEHLGSGIFVKAESDSRITRVGKVLRKTSLDELPQLFNVHAGQMSLVGPRPPLVSHPYKYEEYSNIQRKRFSMRPGITGLTQVTVRNSVAWDGRISVDLDYIEKFTIFLDIKILFKTVAKIFTRESIYLEN